MIFKRKKRHKSTKHGEITSGSRGESRTPTTYKLQLYVATPEKSLCALQLKLKNIRHLPKHCSPMVLTF